MNRVVQTKHFVLKSYPHWTALCQCNTRGTFGVRPKRDRSMDFKERFGTTARQSVTTSIYHDCTTKTPFIRDFYS